MNIKIISALPENPFIVIYKPSGLPSAPLTVSDENNALFQAITLYPQIKTIVAKKPIEYGLLHRIDTDTEGLLLIALTQDFYDSIQKQQIQGKFFKYYKAQCIFDKNNLELLQGFPTFPEKNYEELMFKKKTIITSYFRYFKQGNKEVRPVIINEAGKNIKNKIGKLKLYSTEIEFAGINQTEYSFICKISSGFKHQVRCHLCFIGFPIINDKIYNFNFSQEVKNLTNIPQMKFKAYKIEFSYKEKNYCFMI